MVCKLSWPETIVGEPVGVQLADMLVSKVSVSVDRSAIMV